jgi:hypothetical protein
MSLRVGRAHKEGDEMKLSAILGFGLLAVSVTSHAMTLDEFLRKVESDNSYSQSQILSAEASQLRESEGPLLTSPDLYTLGNATIDKRQTQNPSFEGTRRNSNTYQLGVEQQSIWGLKHKLYYSLDQTELIGADHNFSPNPSASKSSFNYEISLPIWRNGFGRSTQDQINSIVSQNKSESFAAQFNRKQIKVNATAVYWQLKSAQELFALSNELLESNDGFLNWTRRRVRDRLGEESDLRQAEAIVALREYELEQARTEVTEAQQLFNEMLELPPGTPVPQLEERKRLIIPRIETIPA